MPEPPAVERENERRGSALRSPYVPSAIFDSLGSINERTNSPWDVSLEIRRTVYNANANFSTFLPAFYRSSRSCSISTSCSKTEYI